MRTSACASLFLGSAKFGTLYVCDLKLANDLQMTGQFTFRMSLFVLNYVHKSIYEAFSPILKLVGSNLHMWVVAMVTETCPFSLRLGKKS